MDSQLEVTAHFTLAKEQWQALHTRCVGPNATSKRAIAIADCVRLRMSQTFDLRAAAHKAMLDN